jgi:16S rRNA (cytidine1402-2'-O)-methyltransferase
VAGDARAAGGTLYVVATPIGNLRDVTLRALDVLGAVSLIAAEDTRLTRRLLQKHGIETRSVSFHARSGPARLTALLEHLRGGSDLALVTDAGTPLVSDPGGELVAAWAAEEGTVVPVPGPSAVLAAIVSSGLAGPRWSFEGFLPRRGAERWQRLARMAADERATVLFEAPSRLGATLRDLASACGSDRSGAVCRELTKLHEQVVRRSLGELVEAVASGSIPERGEIVIVLGAGVGRGPADHAAADATAALARARVEVERLVAGGLSRSAAAKQVAAATGVARRALYAAGRGNVSRER